MILMSVKFCKNTSACRGICFDRLVDITADKYRNLHKINKKIDKRRLTW